MEHKVLNHDKRDYEVLYKITNKTLERSRIIIAAAADFRMSQKDYAIIHSAVEDFRLLFRGKKTRFRNL